jgi:hypothetical protein
MKKLIHYDASQLGQLVCDNPSCDYVDVTGQVFSPALIGKPCPKCGSNLLTEKDYNSTANLLKVIDWINRWFGWLGTSDYSKGKPVSFRIHDDTYIFQEKKD